MRIIKWNKNKIRDKSGENKQSKGRTIRKLMGGGAGEVQKKYSRKGKLNEKKFMHAN